MAHKPAQEIKYHVAIIAGTPNKLIQDEPYSQQQIRDICFVHNATFTDVNDSGQYRFYHFRVRDHHARLRR